MAMMNWSIERCINRNPGRKILIFVGSRHELQQTAQHLIAQCATSENPKQFLHTDSIDDLISTFQDKLLRLTATFGIGILSPRMSDYDYLQVTSLFEDGILRVLVAMYDLAWDVDLTADLVIVKGTKARQFDGEQSPALATRHISNGWSCR